jgi:outer membrane immunogenic protein
MRLIATLMSTVAVAGMVTAASAADLPARMPTKAPDYVQPTASWTGFYAGVNVGGGWGSNDVTGGAISTTVKPNGVLGGGQVGYNWQTGGLLFGVEADIQGAGLQGSTAVTAGAESVTETDKLNYFGTVRGRLGFVQNAWLGYVTGGWAYTTINRSGTAAGPVAGTFSTNTSKSGYALGGGVEWMFAPRWTAKLEYLYLGFNGDTQTYTTLVPATTVTYGRLNENVVRVGANYHF